MSDFHEADERASAGRESGVDSLCSRVSSFDGGRAKIMVNMSTGVQQLIALFSCFIV